MSDPALPLVEVTAETHDVELDLAYATDRNVTGRPVYRRAACYLHRDAEEKLRRAIDLARPLGYRLKIFDAFRPAEAQWRLWEARPDPDFLADPLVGSPHTRGVAADLTLVADGRALDMGTEFDAFTPLSHHASREVTVAAQRNRFTLLGIMSAAGWDFYGKEGWHYQLFDARSRYPLLSDSVLPRPML
jgi:zinc D-Ala-D-Ala dipeptidase